MPTLHFKNSTGKEIRVTPEAVSRSLPNFYHCMTEDEELITIHRDNIIIRYSLEEVEAIRQKQILSKKL